MRKVNASRYCTIQHLIYGFHEQKWMQTLDIWEMNALWHCNPFNTRINEECLTIIFIMV